MSVKSVAFGDVLPSGRASLSIALRPILLKYSMRIAMQPYGVNGSSVNSISSWFEAPFRLCSPVSFCPPFKRNGFGRSARIQGKRTGDAIYLWGIIGPYSFDY